MATIRNKEISKTGGVCLSFVAVLAIAAATLFTSGKPVEELSENAAVGRKSVITAAGATLPLPFYSEAFKMYWEKNDIPVTYAGIGTERGFRSLKNQQIDFAGVDVPPTKAELDSLPVKSILVPTCMGAVTIAYNLEGVCQPSEAVFPHNKRKPPKAPSCQGIPRKKKAKAVPYQRKQNGSAETDKMQCHV